MTHANGAGPRFGVWAPVYGTWGARTHPDDPVDASYARTREVIRRAEAHGFASVLLAEHIVSPQDEQAAVLETWTASAALAEATERMEIIAAVKPLLFHPGVLAKLAIGIDHISDGRFAINLVSAWFRPEMAHLGIDMPPHDERYEYSAEWLGVVRSLWAGEPVDHHGARFDIDGLRLVPSPTRPGGPTVYFGGESDPARALAARAADVFFINGRSLEDTTELIDDLRRRPRAAAPLRFGLSAFVIARPDEDEALAELDHLQALAARDDRSRLIAGTDPAVAMMKVNAGVPRVGTNGGTLAGLVGSYDQVAQRIGAFTAAGIELFMLQFQPLEAEVERFGTEVIPRVRAQTLSAA
ncbi:MAG: alkanesulfonate monooxygenase [Solirubrobacteraceae bacterium]